MMRFQITCGCGSRLAQQVLSTGTCPRTLRSTVPVRQSFVNHKHLWTRYDEHLWTRYDGKREAVTYSNHMCMRSLSGGSTRSLSHSSPLSSVIYASHYQEGNVAIVEVDLDLRGRFKDIHRLDENITRRGMEHINVYHLASKLKTLRDLGEKKVELDTEREIIARAMSGLVKQQQSQAVDIKKEQYIERGKQVKEYLRDLNKYYYELEEDVILNGLRLPVDLHPSTPLKGDEILKQMGNKPEFSFRPLGHMELGKRTGLVHHKNVGSGKYFLRGDAALLEQDITYCTGQKLGAQGFVPVSCPDMVKTLVVEGCGLDITEPDKVYSMQDHHAHDADHHEEEDHSSNRSLHLTGVSPIGFSSYITKMNFEENCLPHKWFAVGRNYNPKRNNRDLGLFAAPQSTVVEMFGVAKDTEQTDYLYNDFLSAVWDLYKEMFDGLALRVISRAPPTLRHTEAGRVDVQAWSPWLQQYITVGCVSSWSDFLSRRLMSKWSPHVDRPVPGHYIHSVHATAVNVTTLLGVLIENGQTKHGKIELPHIPVYDS